MLKLRPGTTSLRWTIWRAHAFQERVQVLDGDGAPRDLTGAAARLLLTPLGAELAVLEATVGAGIAIVDAATGVLEVDLSPTQTRSLSAGDAALDLAVTAADGAKLLHLRARILVRETQDAIQGDAAVPESSDALGALVEDRPELTDAVSATESWLISDPSRGSNRFARRTAKPTLDAKADLTAVAAMVQAVQAALLDNAPQALATLRALATAVANSPTFGADVLQRLGTVEAGQGAAAIGYATKAAMDADLAHAAGVLALVTNDPVDAANQMYRKNGASGSGSWVAAVDRISQLAPALALQQNMRDGDLFAVLDSAGRVLQIFRADGTMHAKFALSAGAGLIKSGDAAAGYSLAVDAANLVPGQGGLVSQPVVEGDLFAIADTNGRVLLRVRADGTVLGKFQVDSSEIVLARGSRVALGDRLGQGLTPYGIVDSPIWGEWRLRETRQRLRLRALGEAGMLTIAAIGDSWTHKASRWSGALATALAALAGDAGAGWTGLAWGGGTTSLPNGNAQPSIVGYAPVATDWTVNYGASTSPDICSITSATAGAKQTITGPAGCSAVVLYYLGGGGSVCYRWDGGAWTTLDLSAGSGPLTATLTGLPGSAWTLEIEIVSGSSTLCGLDIQKSSSGVRFHKLGATGSRAEQWATVTAAAWQAGIAALAPNLVIIMHGTNDQGSSRPPSAFRTDIDTLITRLRVAVPAVDILLVAPCENQRTNSVAMADYADQLQELAVLRACAFLDLQPFFGAVPADYAAGSTRPWFNADQIHPEPASGGRAIMDAIYRLLTTR